VARDGEAVAERIAKLDLNQSSFFDHRDPAAVKRISERKLDI
jgi:2,5-diketo-D-gluconate reductase A